MQHRVLKKHIKSVLPIMKMGVFNARSICNKTVGVLELLSDQKVDICMLSETWLRKGDTSKISEMKDLGYNTYHCSRPGRGGGVAILYKKTLRLTKIKNKAFKSFEHIECSMMSGSSIVRLTCIYRSPTAAHSYITDFLNDFDQYLEELIHHTGKIIICGDFNIHMENTDDPDTKKFSSLLERYGLIQHVSCPTHINGGTLDLVLTRSNTCDKINLENLEALQTPTTSDHYLISFTCTTSPDRTSSRIKKSGRKINEIDMNSFKRDILSSDLNCPEKFSDCETAVDIYNHTLTKILDDYAPLVSYSVNPGQSKWINSECQDARRKRRKAERDNGRLKTQESKGTYRRLCKETEEVLTKARNNYYKDQLNVSKSKKDTYRIVNNLMDRNLSQRIVPNKKEGKELCEEMKDFFVQKVDNIYSNIEGSANDISQTDHSQHFSGTPLSQFKPVSEEDLRETIKELNKKDCEEDPVPIKILMQCLDELMQILLFIINDSLTHGHFPSLLKNALVRPAIKDENGDINSYKNYRPISNLPFLSKILEKCVQKQLDEHLNINNLHATHQSGYRKNHSCETATLTIYNDLLCLNDTKSKVVLLLLDLSAAFDTVNHEILIAKLKKIYGLKSTVINWFKSYLSDRTFTVTINGQRSSKCYLRIGVPQGSILGPILFILYTKELSSIAEKHGFSIHLYADDTQLYIEFNPLIQNFSNIEERIMACLQEIKTWMQLNKLKLNPDKTEALLTQTRNNFFTFTVEDIQLDQTNDEKITPSPVVKSLGVLFDEYLTFEKQVDMIVKTCNIHLRNLRVIGSKLSYDLKRQLVHCLIFSKLDYCNGLLFGLPDCLINKLQKVQNSCVRFLFGSKEIHRWDRVSSFLKQAHFLPIRRRIEYKIALTVFKCLNNIAPSYMSNLITPQRQSIKALRCDNDFFKLTVPPVSHLRQTERSFSYCGPSVWNQLPYRLRTMSDVKVFKSELKTYLFKKAFDI